MSTASPSPRERHRQTTLPNQNSSANNSPLSLDALLSFHSSAQDPKLAALEQAVSERNVLSSQNSQLWKLIEKQRSGYNQILKELERVRGERDSYKARLAVATGVNPDKRLASRERSQKTTLDSQNIPSPRQNMARFNSDEQVIPRLPPNLHHSRSQEPLTMTSSSLSASQSSPASSSLSVSQPSSRQKSSLAPLTVPPRVDTLPALSATQEAPPLSFNSADPSQKYTHFTHGYNDSIISSLSSNSHNSSTRAASYTRKGSVTDSINSVSTDSSSAAETTAGAYDGVAPSAMYDHSSQNTPQPAPAGYMSSAVHTPSQAQDTVPPQILTSLATPTAAHHHSSPSNDLSSANISMLSPAMQTPLSRESRITLPDEAKQYIANMGESPTTSPRTNIFVAGTPSQLSQSFPAPLPDEPEEFKQTDRDHEFLDMDEEDEIGEEEEEDEAEFDQGNDVEYEVVNPPPVGASMNFPVPPSSSSHQVQQSLQSSSSSGQAPARKSSNQHSTAAEDFPLPPNMPLSHPHAEAPAEMVYQNQLTSNFPAPLQHPTEDIRQPQRLDIAQSNAIASSGGFFRALPLLPTDLPHTKINVSHSFVRPNDRGKEVLSFVVHVDPGKGKEGWKVEKMYSDVLSLDQRVRSSVGKGVGKRIASLPEGKLWKDHAPAKVDQRKAVLENYLQTLINLPIKSNDEVIAFFTTDIVKDTMQPVMQAGHKEGYLTKRGKNFGGWKTRYFVLQGPVLEYFDCRGGTHLGSITVAGAQIGRQQRNTSSAATDEEKEYRHAFLIVEAKKGPGGNHPRHVLCAESDAERDSWVEILVRYFSGTYSEEPVAYVPNSNISSSQHNMNGTASGQPSGTSRPSMSNEPLAAAGTPKKPVRGFSKDDVSISKGVAVPLSQLQQDASNAKLFHTAPAVTTERSSSPSKSVPIPIEGRQPYSDAQAAKRMLERGNGQASSLPDSSPLTNGSTELDPGLRANSELGHYSDMQVNTSQSGQHRQQSPELHRSRIDPSKSSTSFHSNGHTANSSPTAVTPAERVPSPEKSDSKVKISGPMNGAPIPAGYKFGGKDASVEPALTPNDRREKAKSRSFWGFGRPGGGSDKPAQSLVHLVPRAVFGVTLEESLDVAQIASLPAIVFRCIEYLEAKKADQEEGIYRLSGSSAVIKSLKDRFNMEGDVDLLASDEYWDPHAISGLLKSFLRELPASILTRELHLRFLSVIDFVDPQERIKELSQLIATLPIANYSLLRALTAHLILIVQNSAVNKMTMRNVGIVFSPTLGIPAGVFSLMLGEFNRVFNVDSEKTLGESSHSSSFNSDSEVTRRNSRQYSEGAADKLLGLSGRTLAAPNEEGQSDLDDYSSVQDESGTEADGTMESFNSSPAAQHENQLLTPDTPLAVSQGRASNLAANRGLNISITKSERGNRYSRMMGLPASPRPPPSPGGHSSSPSPAPIP